jgi:hypothetical protein
MLALFRLSCVALLALSLGLTVVPPAHAYLDAGTGSMILQVLAGGVAGAVVIGRLYWHRFMRLIGRRKDLQEPAPRP